MNPPGDDMYFGAGQGRKRGERTITGNGDRCRHAEWGVGTSNGGWRVVGMGNAHVGALHTGRGGGKRVKSGRASTMNGYGWGGDKTEEGK